MRTKLKDIMPFKVLLTEASQDPNGLMRVKGVFQKYDEVNANGRVYERKIWETILADKEGVMKRMNERAMVGELEHPEDGQTDLKRVSHVITDIFDDKKGNIVGEAEILNTTHGKELRALFEGGVQVGISSRGSGSVVERDGALYVNADDYVLETFDFVYNNSVSGANPVPVSESAGKTPDQPPSKEVKPMSKKLEELRKMDLELGRVGQQQFESLDLGQRSTLLNQLIESRVSIDAACAEDPSVRTYADRLHKKVDLIEQKLDHVEKEEPGKKPEEGAPEQPANESAEWEANYTALKKITEGVVNRYKALKAEVATESKRAGEKPDEAVQEKRYEALKAITDEIIERYHAAAEISEELLGRAKKAKAQATESRQRYDAAAAIIEGLVERYKGDTVKLFVAGALAKHAGLKESKDAFLKAKDVKEARKMIEAKLGIKPKDSIQEGDEDGEGAPAEGDGAPAAPAEGAPAKPAKESKEITNDQRLVESARKRRQLRESRKRSGHYQPLPQDGKTAAASVTESKPGDIHESVGSVARARALRKKRQLNG